MCFCTFKKLEEKSVESNEKKILLIGGSMNQTSQMHLIANELPDHDCWFSQFFPDPKIAKLAMRYTSILETTIMSGKFRKNSEQYMRDNHLQIDYAAQQHKYDLVLFCTDMAVPARIAKVKTMWIQEGMIDQANWKTKLAKTLHLPAWITQDTSLNGASDSCDIYCAASEGYKNYFAKMGTERSKLFVTGMVNYDNLKQHLHNNFSHNGYVMVATSDIRETFRTEDRAAFLKECVKMADGRQLLFKFHPNEIVERATAEIRENTPADSLIFTSGNTNDMIANSVELITQYSTVVYVGMALGIPVHSYFDKDELKQLSPIQNSGTSAQNIANISRDFLAYKGNKKKFANQYHYQPVAFNQNNMLVGGNKMRA